MRFTSLKNLSLGLALVSLVSVGAASAQSLVGVNAKLDRTLDSQNAKAGEPVTATLTGTVTTADGVKLKRGTELIGKVADVKSEGSQVSLALVFDTAKLKDGKQIPVKTTVLAAFPATQGDEDTAMLPPPEHVNGDLTFDQEPGALNHVSVTSAVRNSNSGTFSSNNGNFKLIAGTFLQVGIGSVNSSSGTNAAE